MNAKLSRNSIILAAAIVGILIVGPSLSYAYDTPGAPSQNSQGKWQQKRDGIFKQLGLTPDQQAQLKADREKYRSQAKPLREQLKSTMEAFKAEMQNTSFDVNKLTQMHNNIKALRDQLADIRFNSIIAVRQVFTPEQYAKFLELKKNHKGRRHHREHRGWGDQGGSDSMGQPPQGSPSGQQ